MLLILVLLHSFAYIFTVKPNKLVLIHTKFHKQVLIGFDKIVVPDVFKPALIYKCTECSNQVVNN